MKNKLLLGLGLFIIFASAAWIIGRLQSSGSLADRAETDLALAGNSLVNRFYVPEETYAPPSGPIKISNDPGQWLQLRNGELRYYLTNSGQIRSLRLGLNRPALADSTLVAQLKPNLKQIFWSPDGQSVIADSGNGFTVHQLANTESIIIDKRVQQLVFSPIGNRVAYLYFDPDTGAGAIKLIFTNDLKQLATRSGTLPGGKTILPTRSAAWQLSWLDEVSLGLRLGEESFKLDLSTGALKKQAAAPAGSSLPPPHFYALGTEYTIVTDPVDNKIYAIPRGAEN